jgi:hypothetical protein
MSKADKKAVDSDAKTMLYRAPGPHEIHGGRFDYTIVHDDDVEAALADGWYLTTPEAKAAHEEALAEEAEKRAGSKPRRAELEQKATELGIPFSSKVSDKKLAAEIAAKVAE